MYFNQLKNVSEFGASTLPILLQVNMKQQKIGKKNLWVFREREICNGAVVVEAVSQNIRQTLILIKKSLIWFGFISPRETTSQKGICPGRLENGRWELECFWKEIWYIYSQEPFRAQGVQQPPDIAFAVLVEGVPVHSRILDL